MFPLISVPPRTLIRCLIKYEQKKKRKTRLHLLPARVAGCIGSFFNAPHGNADVLALFRRLRGAPMT